MVFSKSLGYAVRGILYIIFRTEEGKKVQLSEIAGELSAPRHFLGKVMKQMVKENIIDSMKGPYGGFYINENTMNTSLARLMEITGEDKRLTSCVLKLRKCNALKPCPMHAQVSLIRDEWTKLLISTTIGDLVRKNNPGFIKEIAAL